MKLIKLDKNLKSINIIVLLYALQFRALKCKSSLSLTKYSKFQNKCDVFINCEKLRHGCKCNTLN